MSTDGMVLTKTKGDILLEEDTWQSVPLTPENALFKKGAGGLVSLSLKQPALLEFERVTLFRSFPITNPDEFISVREPDSKRMGRGREIGMVRYLSDFDASTRALLTEELDRRYFTPVIIKIHSVKDKFGYSYWDADTDAGRVTFVLQNPFSNIRILEDGRIFVHDIDGNNYQIPDPDTLDSASHKKIEMYL